MALRHRKRVHIVVLVVPKRGGGFCAHLLAAHPTGGRGAKTTPCEGAVRCRGKVVAKCHGCERAGLCTAHKDGLCVPCQEGGEPEGGVEEEGGGGPQWGQHRAMCSMLAPRGNNHRAFFGEGVGGEEGGGCPPHH